MDVKILDSVGNIKFNSRMQYDDVITNPIWRMDAAYISLYNL